MTRIIDTTDHRRPMSFRRPRDRARPASPTNASIGDRDGGPSADVAAADVLRTPFGIGTCERNAIAAANASRFDVGPSDAP
jgi:hypothetical protein